MVEVVREVVTGKFRARKQRRCTRSPSLTHARRGRAWLARPFGHTQPKWRATGWKTCRVAALQGSKMATIHSLRSRDIKSPGRVDTNGAVRAPTPGKLTPSRPRPIKPTPAKAAPRKPKPGEGASNTADRLGGAQRKADSGQKAGTSVVDLISSSWTSAQSYFRLYWFPVFVLALMAGLLCWCVLHFRDPSAWRLPARKR